MSEFLSTAEHRERFDAMLQNKPDTGAFLESLDGEPVPVRVTIKPDIGEGEMRMMFVFAVIDDECTGYFLADNTRGVTCMLTPETQEELVAANGGSTEGLTVTELFVKRRNFRETALICELPGGSHGQERTRYHAQFYSLRELPQNVRAEFCMPGDPYTHSSNPEGRDAVEYLRELGVIFYRDEFTSEGLLIQPQDGDATPVSERSGFLAYKSAGVFTTDQSSYVKISQWPKPSAEYVKSKGDAFAWLFWNKPYNVVSMQPEAVQIT